MMELDDDEEEEEELKPLLYVCHTLPARVRIKACPTIYFSCAVLTHSLSLLHTLALTHVSVSPVHVVL